MVYEQAEREYAVAQARHQAALQRYALVNDPAREEDVTRGEAMVSGLVEPDEFIVRKSEESVILTHIGRKQFRLASGGDGSEMVATEEQEASRPSLPEEQVKELGRLLVRIEQFYGSPQDVEWCYEGRKFWIVQSRPVTAAPSSAPDIEWTRANLREVLPDLLAPQLVDALCQLLNQAERAHYGKILADESDLGPMVKVFCGRMYFNLSQLRHLCRVFGSAPADVLRGLGHAGEVRPEDEVAAPPDWREFIPALPDIVRLLWAQFRVGAKVRQHTEWTEQMVRPLAAVDLQRFSDQQIWADVEGWYGAAMEQIQTVWLLA
ncbi:MAG: hypothetical protein A3J28_14880 [Acidobacteria bacterium RIFCSPLOWO2_12_FULL_60_22]|nr:MAG: hypothetical protein A3J28_14880 [Acidobacteria bacterium RIFCSPLOWO2_12_FULL_60_22]